MSEFKKKVSVEQAEKENLVSIKTADGKKMRIPFGYCHQQWLDLLAKKQDGDELWVYESPPEAWEHLAGAETISLVRNGEVIDSILLRIS